MIFQIYTFHFYVSLNTHRQNEKEEYKTEHFARPHTRSVTQGITHLDRDVHPLRTAQCESIYHPIYI